MNIVFIIPTGLAAEIGGHAGDGNPAAKLLASTCDTLITHPNVVNASDINEMTENTWYVEGSMLDDFLEGKIQLKRPYKNKILLVVNEVTKDVVNSVSAARATIGADIEIVELETPLEMFGRIGDGGATGIVSGYDELILQVQEYDFDALAIATPIKVDKDVVTNYLNKGGANPWGAVEAIVSKKITSQIKKPTAHSPMDDKNSEVYQVMNNLINPVDPRMAAELVSVSYLHCILKGLHRAPRISSSGLHVNDIDFMVSPSGIWGKPHRACREANIPVIIVKENTTCDTSYVPMFATVIVSNYLEAAGYIQSIKAGVSLESIRRPLRDTVIHYTNSKS